MYSSPRQTPLTPRPSSQSVTSVVTPLERDVSGGEPAIVSSVDITEDILNQHLLFGASDHTAPAGLAAAKALNFANGASIQRPELQRCTIIPFTFKYQGSTGLFGAENFFVRVDVDVKLDITRKCFEEEYWECAKISESEFDPSSVYEDAVIDFTKDLTIVNTYLPARLFFGKNKNTDFYISVDLNNLKTGNIYIDNWFDVRLYTSERMEHPYDKMYVRLNDFFYIGFHARNTRRLDYNVEALIGNELVLSNQVEDTRFIARRINQ